MTVHPDHHIAFVQALYSLPASSCPPGTKLEVRGDHEVVKLYRRGELVKVHPRMPRGSRHTDQDDYPQELTVYTTRSPERLIQRAGVLGEQIGAFAQQLLSGELPRLRRAATGPEAATAGRALWPRAAAAMCDRDSGRYGAPGAAAHRQLA